MILPWIKNFSLLLDVNNSLEDLNSEPYKMLEILFILTQTYNITILELSVNQLWDEAISVQQFREIHYVVNFTVMKYSEAISDENEENKKQKKEICTKIINYILYNYMKIF